MKLLLTRDIRNLGMIGDVVDVKQGFARNYLIPQRLAVEPTRANMKAIEEARVKAAEVRALRAEQMRAAAERLSGTEITIKAAANAEGVLYGSVGPREIAAALRHEGHTVETAQVLLHTPIRHLDNVSVPVEFTEDLTVEVKVWVVREAASAEWDQGATAQRTEADRHDHDSDSPADDD